VLVALQGDDNNDDDMAEAYFVGTRQCSGRVLDSWSKGHGFDSDRGIIRATTLDKLFAPNVPLFTKQYNLVPCEGLHAKSAILLAAA